MPLDKIKIANDKDFDNIAVVSEGRAVGFIKTSVAENTPMKSDNISLISDWSIESTASFPDVAISLARSAATVPMYFVFDSAKTLLGIATYADLNRRAAYLFTYGLGCGLEQWIKENVIKTMDGFGANPDYVRSVRGGARGPEGKKLGISRNDELHMLAGREKESCLSLCFLDELLDIVRNDAAPTMIPPLLPVTISAFEDIYRNRVAHPTRLLVGNLDPEGEVTSLARMWKDMLRFIVEHGIGNEKNRSYVR